MIEWVLVLHCLVVYTFFLRQLSLDPFLLGNVELFAFPYIPVDCSAIFLHRVRLNTCCKSAYNIHVHAFRAQYGIPQSNIKSVR